MEKAQEYLNNMYNAIGTLLIEPDTLYSNREGHLRLARECGIALDDFNKNEREHILKSSYGSLYVRGCNLKPILGNKEWVNEMLDSYNKYKEGN